jgi:hypothetical protein
VDTNAVSFERLARGFLGRASEAAEADVGAPFDARVVDSIDLAHHSEGEIALENLISNLYEYEIPVTERERHDLLAFAGAWKLRDRDRSLIDSISSA